MAEAGGTRGAGAGARRTADRPEVTQRGSAAGWAPEVAAAAWWRRRGDGAAQQEQEPEEGAGGGAAAGAAGFRHRPPLLRLPSRPRGQERAPADPGRAQGDGALHRPGPQGPEEKLVEGFRGRGRAAGGDAFFGLQQIELRHQLQALSAAGGPDADLQGDAVLADQGRGLVPQAAPHARAAVHPAPAAGAQQLRPPADPRQADGQHVPEHVSLHQRPQGQPQQHQEVFARQLRRRGAAPGFPTLQREGGARGREQRPEEAAAGEIPQHEPPGGHQRAAGERHKPVGERGRAGRDPQHPGAAASLRRPGEHEGAAERRAPHRDRAPHDAAAREGGGGLGAGQRALPQLHPQNGGGGAGDPGAEGGEAAAEDGAAAAAGGGRGAQAAAAGGSPGEEPGGDPEETAAGRRQRRRGPRGAGGAGSGPAVGRERRRVLPAGGGRGARRRSLSQPRQEAARPLGLRRAAETPATRPARAARSPETSPGSTGEAAKKGSGADGLEASGRSRAKSGTRKRAAGPGGTEPRPQEEGEAADEGKNDFQAARARQEGEALRLRPSATRRDCGGRRKWAPGGGGNAPAPGQYTLGTTTWRRAGEQKPRGQLNLINAGRDLIGQSSICPACASGKGPGPSRLRFRGSSRRGSSRPCPVS